MAEANYPTLQDVLALSKSQMDTDALYAAATDYVLGNHEWLTRCELERAARLDRGLTVHCPVLVVSGSTGKPTTSSVGHRGGFTLVIVGANWTPEVKG